MATKKCPHCKSDIDHMATVCPVCRRDIFTGDTEREYLDRGKGTGSLWSIALLAAALTAVAGFLFLSQATMGVGLVGLAGCLLMFARIAQASAYHAEIKRLLRQR